MVVSERSTLQLPLSTTVTLRHVPHQKQHTRTRIYGGTSIEQYTYSLGGRSHMRLCVSLYMSLLSICIYVSSLPVCRCLMCTHHTSHRSQEHELSYVQRRDRSCTYMHCAKIQRDLPSLNARGENAINIHLQARRSIEYVAARFKTGTRRDCRSRAVAFY